MLTQALSIFLCKYFRDITFSFAAGRIPRRRGAGVSREVAKIFVLRLALCFPGTPSTGQWAPSYCEILSWVHATTTLTNTYRPVFVRLPVLREPRQSGLTCHKCSVRDEAPRSNQSACSLQHTDRGDVLFHALKLAELQKKDLAHGGDAGNRCHESGSESWQRYHESGC